MPGSIAALGSANLDFVVRADRLPGPGETIFGSSFTTVPGGKGLNQAVAAQRAGGAVCFVGAVGHDTYGAGLREFLHSEGIDTSALDTVDGPTGTAHITVQESGENSIVVVAGANGEVHRLTDEGRAAILRSDALLMQFEVPQTALLDAARLAREHGILTVLTPAPAIAPLPGLLEHIDIVVPNQHEVTLLAGIEDAVAATLALSEGRLCVTTLGADGVLVARNGAIETRVPARRVRPVDTTAAGDTFTGTLVARLVAGDSLDRALRWATTAASISVTRHGAASSMPHRAEVETLIDTTEGSRRA